MPPLVIPSTVRVGLIWQINSTDYAVNVVHYIVGPSTSIGQTDANDLAADIDNDFSAAGGWLSVCSNEVELNRITVRDLRQANLPEFTGQIGDNGANGTVPAPPQTSLVVTLRTAMAGRSFRGRIYLPGVAAAFVTTGGVAQAAVVPAANQTVASMMTQIVDGQEWSLGVASPTLGETNAVISAAARDNVFDTQRRRSYPGI